MTTETKTQWTPGPWEFKSGSDNMIMDVADTDAPVLGSICDSKDGLHLVRVWSDVPEAEANARLIAHAPEMAELLIDLSNSETEEEFNSVMERTTRLLVEIEGAK